MPHGRPAPGDITNRNHNAVRNQIFRALKATDGRGLILTPGCVIRYPLDEEMLASVRKTKEEVEAGCSEAASLL